MELFQSLTKTKMTVVPYKGVGPATTAISKRFVAEGGEPAPGKTPEEFGQFIRAELAKWSKVVRTAGIQPL